MPACEAYSGSDDARIGFFDDCFLVSNDDSGTFRTEADRDYMAADARFTPMTGETCGLNVTLTNCTNALYRLVEENWDLLNYGYNLDVLGGWLTEGCYDTIRDRLGYRFEFKATSGNLSVTNVGFGNVYNMYGVRFLLVPTSLANGATSGQGYVQEVNFDIRKWRSNTTVEFAIPNAPNKDYIVLLDLYDTYNDIEYVPDYRILFSNAASKYSWVNSSRLNDLNITPNVGKTTANCTSTEFKIKNGALIWS